MGDKLVFEAHLLIVPLVAGLAVLCLAAAAYLVHLRRHPAYRRVEALAGRADFVAGRGGAKLRQRLLGWLGRLAAAARPSRDWQLAKLRQELVAAGFRSPQAVNIFLGLKVLLAVALPGVIWLSPLSHRWGQLLGALVLLGLACLGMLLPNMGLEMARRRRADRIDRELPEVLDLLVLAVEAGLGLDAALKRVSQEMALSSPILAEELAIVSFELKAGVARDVALKNLATRCGVDDIASLVNMLNQADRFGVSIGRSLRVQADTVRTKRRQRLEEKATKIPLKLLFPVLFMIFPAILAVMIGPALIKVQEQLLK